MINTPKNFFVSEASFHIPNNISEEEFYKNIAISYYNEEVFHFYLKLFFDKKIPYGSSLLLKLPYFINQIHGTDKVNPIEYNRTLICNKYPIKEYTVEMYKELGKGDTEVYHCLLPSNPFLIRLLLINNSRIYKIIDSKSIV